MLTTKEIIEVMNGPDPVSIIRCGDGEKVLLDGPVGYEGSKKFADLFNRVVGFLPKTEDCLQIRQNLIEAIKGCDILGVPDQPNLAEMDEDWRDVEKTIKELIPQATKKRCSVNIHLDLLDGGYEKFLNGKIIYYIGCREISEKLSKTFNSPFVAHCVIAPEARFTTYKGERHYPNQFNRVKEWIKEMKPDTNKKILLVGAGIVGKIYCNWWRDNGGKALDIGSVMDEWAGAATRGPERGLDKYVKTKWTL